MADSTENTSQTAVSSNGFSPHIGDTSFEVSDGDYDVQKMRDLSLEDTDPSEEKENATTLQAPAEKIEEEVKTQEASAKEETSDTEGSEGEQAESGEKEAGDSEETQEFVTLKAGEKEHKIPRDAEVTLKIDGKKETLPLQEVLNKASGVINVERANTELGRERKAFQVEKQKYAEETAIVNAHAQALLDMNDPYEFAEYYAALKGEDPDKIFEGMISKTLDHIEKWSKMTETERLQERKIRKYERAEKARLAKEKTDGKVQEVENKKQYVLKELEKTGLTTKDYENALFEMSEKVKKGESLGEAFEGLETITEDDVIDYAIISSSVKRVTAAVTKVSAELTKDKDFISKLTKALHKFESLHGRMSEAEVFQFAKGALELDNKTLSESLSKKVEAKKTTSQSVNSRKQKQNDEDEDGDDLTFEEFEERRRYAGLAS